MIKIKLADSVIKSHLVDSKGNSYCSIPISVDKKLNVEWLFDKLVAIAQNLKVMTNLPVLTILYL